MPSRRNILHCLSDLGPEDMALPHRHAWTRRQIDAFHNTFALRAHSISNIVVTLHPSPFLKTTATFSNALIQFHRRWAQLTQKLAPLTASPIIKKISFTNANPITRIFR